MSVTDNLPLDTLSLGAKNSAPAVPALSLSGEAPIGDESFEGYHFSKQILLQSPWLAVTSF